MFSETVVWDSVLCRSKENCFQWFYSSLYSETLFYVQILEEVNTQVKI